MDFAGYEKTKKNRLILAATILIIFFIQSRIYSFVGYSGATKLYPLMTHLPMVILLIVYFKKSFSIALVSVLTAYLCCQPPNWLGIALHYYWDHSMAFFLGDSLGFIVMLFLIKLYIAKSVHQVISYSKNSLYIFGSFPLIYYIFDYTTTVYTEFLYSGARIVVEFFPSVLSLFYILFVVVYNNETEKRNNLEFTHAMLETQSERAMKEITALQQIQQQTAIYRHDMRHHLSLIYSFIENNAPESALDYIKQTKNDIDQIVPIQYCENSVINLVLSAYARRAENENISFQVKAKVPEFLSIPSTDICTLLSNGLENAINSTLKEDSHRSREIILNCKLQKKNLLIVLSNTYYGKEIEIKNGLPQTNKEGHGYGAKSIAILVDKYKGYYSFSVEENLFILNVLIPI